MVRGRYTPGMTDQGTPITLPPAAPPAGTPVAPLALFALIAGGAAFLFGLVPVFGMILAVGAGVLAAIALIRKKPPSWMPILGGVLAATSFLTGVVVLVVLAVGGAPASQPNTLPSETPVSEVTPTPDPTPIEVPNVVGLTTDEALAQLIAAGFDTSTEGENGIVASQNPEGGTPAIPGSSVHVTSSIDLSKFQKVTKREYAQIAKDPDAHIGQNVIVVGVVTQFDSATGPCTMRADTGYKRTEYSYEYDVNTIVISGDGDNCPVLDPVVQGDHVTLRATILGAFEYDTAIGGTATAVLMQAYTVKVLPAQEF